MFSTRLENFLPFLSNLKLSFAKSFSLEESKTGHLGKVQVTFSDSSNFLCFIQNGHIFVYTGMIEFCDNKDQLAVILGHEMAHALLLHAVSILQIQCSYNVILYQLTIFDRSID